jgi:N-acylneuraminate cytidylyltransferase/CMP-N,N'-diacetyllegionaminic acid synthase
MQQTVALIPARGGSKGIPRKNLIPLCGKPLIAWTIQAARDSGVFSRVLVSTDDPEIADTAQRYGAETPFLRPAELASDNASGIAPVLHALQWLAQHQSEPDLLALLQPTSPLRTTEDILGAAETIRRTAADSLVSVVEADRHPVWALQRDEHGILTSCTGQPLAALQQQFPTRQSLPEALYENGAIYIAEPSVIRSTNSFYGERLQAWLMPAERSVDIDTLLDLQIAEILLKEQLHAHR